MEELFKNIGGFPGLVALVAAGVLAFWRIRVPQIGIDYLSKQLEVHRSEIAAADKDRAALRVIIDEARRDLQELETRYMYCLTDRERCRRHIRQLERQVRTLGHEPVEGDEERG